MRKRRWALFAFIIMLAFIFLSLESWRLLKANEKLKDYILAEFSPIVGEKLSISKVHVSFGNIHILGVRFEAPAKNISIDIRDLRIGYSFVNLLLRGFHPKYISQDALFIGPTITINSVDSLLPEADLPSAPPPSRQMSLAEDLKDLTFFNHISIKDGDIIYVQDKESIVPLVHSVQGGIYKQRDDSLLIDLDGAFFNSEGRNIRIVGNGDFKKRIITHVQATLTEYKLQHGLPALSEKLIVLDRGELTGTVNVRWHAPNSQYRVTGDLEIHDAGGDIFGGKLHISDMFSKGVLLDNKIIIQESEQVVNNSRITIAGVLENVTDPFLDITGESTNFDLGAFSSLLGTQLAGKISGVSVLRVSVRGPLDNIVVHQNIRGKAVTIKNTLLQDFYADVRFDDEMVTVDSSRAFVGDNELAFSGSLDLSSEEKLIGGELRGHGNVETLFAIGHIDSSISLFSNFCSTLSGSIKRPLLEGKVSLEAYSSNTDTLALNAFFDYQDKKITFISDKCTDGIVFNSTIDWNQSPPAIAFECRGGEKILYFFRDIPAEKYLAENIHSSITAIGNLDNIELSTEIRSNLDDRIEGQMLHVDAEIARKGSSFKSDGVFIIKGDTKNACRGEFSFEKTATVLSIKKIDIENELTASLNIDLGESGEMSGALELTGFDISRLSTSPDSSLTGKINSAMQVEGTFADPLFAGWIDVDELSYRGVGPYESLIHFDYDQSLFNLEKFTLDFGKSTLLSAHGRYDRTCDAIDFSVKGAGFDVGHVLGAAGKDSLISGATHVDLLITGTAHAPVVQGLVAIKEGRMWNIPFDELELKLAPSVTMDHMRESATAVIENFRLERSNVYEIVASGTYPFHSSDSLILDINGRGNFLQILNDIQPFFRSPQGNCSLTSRIRGTPKNPYLEKAHLTIKDASMEFASVVAPITHVQAELSFDADEQFLNLSVLQGDMGEKPFRIYNDLVENVVSAKPLDNLRIGDSDFHFGVLILETPQKGVPLNFVGIMEPGEFGMLELVGRENGEKFYFGGSPDGLTLRGRINLYDTEIMYPFYENTQKSSDKLREFLRNLEWDLLVVPMKNTRFVRNFPGAIDQIYVDLKLDENYGGLEFTDQLVDDTFRINGYVRSTKGMIEYLDMNFRVEQAGVDFDRSSLVPVAYGSAKTTVTDSLGISSNILLTLQTVDNTMNKKSVDDIVRQEEGRARFDQIRFKLSSDNPNVGSSEAQILASLGYSTNNLQNNAVSAIGYSTDNLIFRPLFRPMEKELEQTFGLDYVRFSSQLTRNIIMFNLNNNLELNNRLALLESTKIIVGKYLANHFFLQYTGQIESGVGYRYKEKNLGFHHTVGLEYQINPQVLVELEYDYDSLMLEKRDDKRIILRHWFPF